MIAVTFALPADSADFVRLLEKPMLNSREGVESIRGRIHGQSVAVLHTGVGERSCCAQIEPFLRRQQFKYLVSAGFAGAVEKELQVGHLLLAENFSSQALLQSPHLDLGDEGLFLGKLVTVPEIVGGDWFVGADALAALPLPAPPNTAPSTSAAPARSPAVSPRRPSEMRCMS